MFPRRDRLTRATFPGPRTRAARVSGTYFTILVPYEGQGYAAVVSKKAVKSAVGRHSVKRRVLEALRAIKRPGSLVVYARAGSDKLSYREIRDELSQLLSKIS